MKKRICYRCQEIHEKDEFVDGFGFENLDCYSCRFLGVRMMIAYKRELTGDLKTYPYF